MYWWLNHYFGVFSNFIFSHNLCEKSVTNINCLPHPSPKLKQPTPFWNGLKVFHLHAVNVKMTKSRKSYLLLFSISFSVALYIPIFTMFQFLKWFSIIKPDRLVIMKLWLALVYSPYSGYKVQPSYYRMLFSLRRLIWNLCLVFGYFDKWTRNELKLSLGSFYSTIVSKYYWMKAVGLL